MNSLSELEQEARNLPAQEREHFALTMWESLEGHVSLDPDGVAVALARDKEIEAGSVQTIDHAEFRRRTGATE